MICLDHQSTSHVDEEHGRRGERMRKGRHDSTPNVDDHSMRSLHARAPLVSSSAHPRVVGLTVPAEFSHTGQVEGDAGVGQWDVGVHRVLRCHPGLGNLTHAGRDGCFRWDFDVSP